MMSAINKTMYRCNGPAGCIDQVIAGGYVYIDVTLSDCDLCSSK